MSSTHECTGRLLFVRKQACLVASAITLTCAQASANAATLTVTHFGDDIYCDAIGCSLRGALLTARNGDTVVWASNLSYPAVTTLTDTIIGRPLLIFSGVTVQGPGADKLSIDAQDLSRVLHLDTRINQNYSASISGLRLMNGRIAGISYNSTPCGGQGSGPDNQRAGGPADGGCIWADASTSLRLQRVALEHCRAVGGAGESGNTRFLGYGNSGGDGGHARGGAIFSLGNLTLQEVSVHHASVNGGQAGSGEAGSIQPGNGGDGGYVSGGAVWAAGTMEWRNVSTSDIGAYAGQGGQICGPTGTPGIGGDVYGGVVATFEPSTISFSSLEVTGIQAGSYPYTQSGIVYGNVLNSPASVVVNHSVLNAAVDNGDVESSCAGALIVASSSQSRGPCADASVTSIGALTPIIAANGLMTLMPEAASPIVDAASSCLDAQSNVVAFDARGASRPFNGACDLGAHEYDGILFKHGFE